MEPPRVALVATDVFPHAEVGVVVLAADLEQVGVVGDDPGGDAAHPHLAGDVGLPNLDRAPWPPQEFSGTAEDVVPRRHTGQRAREVTIKTHGAFGETINVRCFEFGSAVITDHVAIQTVQ